MINLEELEQKLAAGAMLTDESTIRDLIAEIRDLRENGRPGRQVPIDGLGSHQSDKDREDDLRSLRKQAREWRGGHIFDGPDCLLCGVFGPTDEEDPCVVEKLGNVLCGIGWDLMASGAVRLRDDGQDYDGFVNLQLGILGRQMIRDDQILRQLFTAQKNLFHTMYQLGFGTEADLVPKP